MYRVAADQPATRGKARAEDLADLRSASMNALALSLSTSSVGMAVIDGTLGIIHANAAFETLFDLPAYENNPTLTSCVERLSPSGARSLGAILAHGEAASLQFDGPGLRVVTVHIAVKDSATRLIVAHSTEASPTVAEQAVLPADPRDPLTGLGNRVAFDAATRPWQAQHDVDATLALIMIDLDRFKQVNDTLGHATGDTLLQLVATRLRSATRENDTVIRMGGDEFVIIHTDGHQPEGAQSMGQRVVDLLSRPFLVDGHQINIGASVGIALSQVDMHDPVEILRRADLALYEAKTSGRGALSIFEPHMAQQAMARRALEVSLRRALALKEFSLHYQPQVTLNDGRITGFEALIRWHNPERGMISPGDFIPLAEEIGEIHAIGEWAIREACKEAASWPGALAVNVSPLQFQQGDIVEVVRESLAATGLAPDRLELEITESVLMADTDAILRSLWALRELGVGIAMDDFGTGYSSLSYLNSFPFSKLKIDQSFIQNRQSEKSQALINAILKLGQSLGMTTIAEGIETNIQYEALASSGCISAQGYLISRPMPQDQIAAYLSCGDFRLVQ